jgi:hypothetical protein
MYRDPKDSDSARRGYAPHGAQIHLCDGCSIRKNARGEAEIQEPRDRRNVL